MWGSPSRGRGESKKKGAPPLRPRPPADPPRQAHVEGPQLPTRAELDHATATTAAAIADPASGPADIYRAAEGAAAILIAYWQGHGAEEVREIVTRGGIHGSARRPRVP